ncbi:MAG TPA: outer membrane protein transport protein [Candidatus Eisenbacteria bacterium]|jgi:long-chain fatty acid transport protein
MRFRRILLAAAVAGCVLPPAGARAAGYGIYEQSAAVLGMAGAGTASVHDPSAVFFNPAALMGIEGTRIYGGGSLLQPFTSFAGVAPHPGFGVTEEMKAQQFYPPTAYFTHHFPTGWALGLGLNSPFGLGVDWKNPDQFTGRYIVARANLRTISSSLVAAHTLRPNLDIGFGGNLVYANVDLANREFVPKPGGGGGQVEVANVDLTSDWTPGYAWNAALSWRPGTRMMWGWIPLPGKVGLTYRSRVILHVDGNVDITQIPTGDGTLDAVVAGQLPPDQAASTVLRLPSIAALGLAWSWGSAWTLESDAVFTEWSTFKDLPIYLERTPSANQRIVESYDDSFQFRFGAERRGTAFTWRAGYYMDQAAAPTESVSPILPDADRQGATLGVGLGFGKDRRLSLDLYELALFVKNRKTEGVNRDGFEGEYKSYVNSTGLSLAYRW